MDMTDVLLHLKQTQDRVSSTLDWSTVELILGVIYIGVLLYAFWWSECGPLMDQADLDSYALLPKDL